MTWPGLTLLSLRLVCSLNDVEALLFTLAFSAICRKWGDGDDGGGVGEGKSGGAVPREAIVC